MRLLITVEPREVIGGGVRAAINLSASLLEQSPDLTIGLFGVSHGAATPPLPEGLSFFSSGAAKPFSFKYCQEFNRLVLRFRPQVIHAMGLFTALLAIIIRFLGRHDYKIVVTVHRVTNTLRFYFIARRVAGFIASKIDYGIFLTTEQRAHYFDNIHFSPAKHTVIPNVIPEKKVDAEAVATTRRDLLDELGVDILVGYVGRLIESKRIDIFIQTVSLIRKRGLNVGAIIVGDGPTEHIAALRNLTSELGLQKSIRFTGFVPDPERYILVTDCILFPTQREALPNLLIETYMLGKPIVISSIHQLRSLTENGVNSLVADKHTPESYALALDRLFHDEQLLCEIRKGARKTYLRMYQPAAVAGRHRDIYDFLTKEITHGMNACQC